MTRLTIFAKGNSDLRDSLHAFRQNGQVLWNGLNEVLRESYFCKPVRLRHETWTRSDALLAARGRVPDGLGCCFEPPGYSLESQFSTALFETPADVVILSIQPDVTMQLARDRRDGTLFYPGPAQTWSNAARRLLQERFDDLELLDVGSTMGNLERIVARLRERGDPAVLVYNLSPVIPGEWVHSHAGLPDTLATRIRRFNLGLVELSQRIGISIVDLDSLVARRGADRLKLDGIRLNAVGCRLAAEEVARILDDLGCFDERVVTECE